MHFHRLITHFTFKQDIKASILYSSLKNCLATLPDVSFVTLTTSPPAQNAFSPAPGKNQIVHFCILSNKPIQNVNSESYL